MPKQATATQQDTPQNRLPKDGKIRLMTLADALDISHITLRKWIKQDKIPAPRKVNGVILFDCQKIHTWLDNQPVYPATDAEVTQ